jgi:hypothetical protein
MELQSMKPHSTVGGEQRFHRVQGEAEMEMALGSSGSKGHVLEREGFAQGSWVAPIR